MRFAVLSDIHSNYAALRAVIADAESRQPDYWLFLGDYVTDCPYPHRTVEFLRDFSQTSTGWLRSRSRCARNFPAASRS